MYHQNEWVLTDLAYKIKVYSQKRGITTDQALEELKRKLEDK